MIFAILCFNYTPEPMPEPTVAPTPIITQTPESQSVSQRIMKITHYCSCAKCNGSSHIGRTASGKDLKIGMVAMKGVPFGTVVEINGKKYVVEDRPAKSGIVDIYVESHEKALKLGTYKATVKIIK